MDGSRAVHFLCLANPKKLNFRGVQAIFRPPFLSLFQAKEVRGQLKGG